jgi:hypothetical protein
MTPNEFLVYGSAIFSIVVWLFIIRRRYLRRKRNKRIRDIEDIEE